MQLVFLVLSRSHTNYCLSPQGDSGGPLICYQTSAWVLVGLASWGLDCRHPIYPSVFTRVTYFTDWISQVKGLTPLPESESVSPHTELQPRPLRAAGSPQPCSILIAAQVWFLLLFMPEAQDQAPGWAPGLWSFLAQASLSYSSTL